MNEERGGMGEVCMVQVVWLETILMKWGGRGREVDLTLMPKSEAAMVGGGGGGGGGGCVAVTTLGYVGFRGEGGEIGLRGGGIEALEKGRGEWLKNSRGLMFVYWVEGSRD